MKLRFARNALAVGAAVLVTSAQAGVVFGFTAGLQGSIARWDAAPQVISGNERSIDGGLRYAVSGGSLEAFRNHFSWDVLPSVADFTTAVQQAFDAWAAVDPVSGLGSALSFVYDGRTAVQGVAGGGININGAEIDLIATNDASFWNPGNNGLQGETWFTTADQRVTLTSGVANYLHSSAIAGADVYLNNNPGAVYNLDLFRRLLTHELGHALGLGDVENDIQPGRFIDDNFDPTSNATKVATLNNSWAGLVNVLDPSGSAGLARYTIGDGTTALAGIDILMESRGLGISAANPVTRLVPLTNDDFGTRQFLYPFVQRGNDVPEPGTLLLAGLGLGAVALRRRRAG